MSLFILSCCCLITTSGCFKSFIVVFSCVSCGCLLSRGLKTNDGAPYFTNYLDVVFDLYVLVTTANSPDVM